MTNAYSYLNNVLKKISYVKKLERKNSPLKFYKH